MSKNGDNPDAKTEAEAEAPPPPPKKRLAAIRATLDESKHSEKQLAAVIDIIAELV
jgi:hypothetical protein